MRVMTVDDEVLALDYIENLLMRTDEVTTIERTQDPVTALEKIAQDHYDVVFLDIEMPGMNGLVMADQLTETSPATDIVFVTAHREYAIEAFELEAMDYLVKPVRFDRLKKTIERLVRNKRKEVSLNISGTTIEISIQHAIKITDENNNEHELNWRTAKARELFLYLLHHQNKTVSKAEIVEMIWSGVSVQKAYSQLYTAVYHIRKTLSPFHEHLQLINVDEGYRLKVEKTNVDIFEWKKVLLETEEYIANGSSKTIETKLEQYDGDYLAYSDLVWPEEERVNHQLIWREKAMALAMHFEQNHQWDRALRWYTKVLYRNPLDEDVYLLQMQVLAKLRRPDQVHEQFKQLQTVMHHELDALPDPAVLSWYEEWKKRTEN
ncbi:response regulator [Salisediminibacterium beveridgei]|uniref:Two-component response regulator n=1 Tax=Salisediminibacterium beveridgei TaxID=632773 RepID=A0A1D7QYL2_9BACI|nr:response regulator [Salisediminibacterium beveridgei]AOM84068.1 two-component response regulator [Salisediminibacterium beveridgei]